MGLPSAIFVVLCDACLLPQVEQQPAQDAGAVQTRERGGSAAPTGGSIAERRDPSTASGSAGASAADSGKQEAGSPSSPSMPDGCSPPCAHGVCRASGQELRCDCSGTSWNGPRCEVATIGPCATDNGGCEQLCSDESGQARCACGPNSVLASDSKHCVGWRKGDKLELSVRGEPVMESTLLSDDSLFVAWAAVRQPLPQMPNEAEVASSRWSTKAGWETPSALTTITTTAPAVTLTLRANSKGDALVLHRWWEGQLIAHALTDSKWGAPAQVDVEKFRSGEEAPATVFDDQGNGLVAFTRLNKDMTRTAVHSASYVKERGWGPLVQIEEDSVEANVYDPQLAMSASGNVLMLWSDFRNRLFAKRWSAQAGWSTASELHGEDTVARKATRLVASAKGEALATWTEASQTSLQLMAATYTETTSWSMPSMLLDLGAPAMNAITQQLAMNPSGETFLVWAEIHDGRSRIWARSFSLHGGWGMSTPISNESGYSYWRPSVAVDAAGNATVAWLEYDDMRSCYVWANRFIAGSGWGKPLPVEVERTGEARSAHAAITSTGTSVVSWATFDPAGKKNTIVWLSSWQAEP